MLVTNLQRFPVGIDGVYNLGPLQSREIPETEDLIRRVRRLKEVNYVSVQFTEEIVAPENQTIIPAEDSVVTVVESDEAVSTVEVTADEVATDEVTAEVKAKPRRSKQA